MSKSAVLPLIGWVRDIEKIEILGEMSDWGDGKFTFQYLFSGSWVDVGVTPADGTEQEVKEKYAELVGIVTGQQKPDDFRCVEENTVAPQQDSKPYDNSQIDERIKEIQRQSMDAIHELRHPDAEDSIHDVTDRESQSLVKLFEIIRDRYAHVKNRYAYYADLFYVAMKHEEKSSSDTSAQETGKPQPPHQSDPNNHSPEY